MTAMMRWDATRDEVGLFEPDLDLKAAAAHGKFQAGNWYTITSG